jgi:hypothetical protein
VTWADAKATDAAMTIAWKSILALRKTNTGVLSCLGDETNVLLERCYVLVCKRQCV